MNRRNLWVIAAPLAPRPSPLTLVAGALLLFAIPMAQAQQTQDSQSPPSNSATKPPPNPEPPQNLPGPAVPATPAVPAAPKAPRAPAPTAAAPGRTASPHGTGASPPATEPGFLGVVTDDRQEKGAGVRVVELQSGGPADIGGLRSGDLITSLNGTAVHNQTDMLPLLQKLAPNSKVTFGVDRGGQQQTIAVTLGTRPPTGQRRYEKFGQIPDPQPEPATGGGIGSETPVGPLPDTLPPGNPTPANEPGRFPADVLPGGAPLPGGPSNGSAPNGLPNLAGPDSGIQLGTRALPTVAPSRRPLLGVRTRPLTGEIQRRLRLPSTQGALVVARTLGSPAAVAGIPLDAVITAVDGKAVGLPQDLTALIGQAGPGREVEITYFYEGSEQHAKVKLAEVALGSSGLLGGSPISAGPVPAPPAPQANQLPVPDDKTRIDALERRVQQLEHRVDDLEQSLRRLK